MNGFYVYATRSKISGDDIRQWVSNDKEALYLAHELKETYGIVMVFESARRYAVYSNGKTPALLTIHNERVVKDSLS